MRKLCDHYLLGRRCSTDYQQAMRRVARSMIESGIADPSALSEDSFNHWMAGLVQGQTTVSNYRRMGMTLWKHAARRKLTQYPTDGVVKVKPRYSPPIAWSMDELNTLLSRCRQLSGVLRSSGCPKWLFFTEGFLTFQSVRSVSHHQFIGLYTSGRNFWPCRRSFRS